MIRAFKGNDCKPIVELWNRSLPRDITSEAQFINWLYADGNFDVDTGEGAWIKEIDGKIVGFVRAIKRRLMNDLMGMEEETGWIPIIFVDPDYRQKGIGTELLEKALNWHKSQGTKLIWICGNSGSAPGYICPGIDVDAYAPAVQLFKKMGFDDDRPAISMSASLLDYDIEKYRREALAGGAKKEIIIETLVPERVMSFLAFMRRTFPGDWNTVARNKIKNGGYAQILVAIHEEQVVGYCQWEDDGHFGPFGVDASMRGQKVGALLFMEACQLLKATDARHVWFNWADPGAARFYRRLGLEATRNFTVMKKNL